MPNINNLNFVRKRIKTPTKNQMDALSDRPSFHKGVQINFNFIAV